MLCIEDTSELDRGATPERMTRELCTRTGDAGREANSIFRSLRGLAQGDCGGCAGRRTGDHARTKRRSSSIPGQSTLARSEFRSGIRVKGSGLRLIARTGFAYQVLGHREDALRIFAKIEALARDYVVTDAAWALTYLAVEDLDKALRSLSRAADQGSAGEDISTATITFNMLSTPVLEQPEFLELRRRLGFAR